MKKKSLVGWTAESNIEAIYNDLKMFISKKPNEWQKDNRTKVRITIEEIK